VGVAVFAVYVDGKPSVFGNTGLNKSLSGISKILKFITTPSDRHDTEGDVGNINIITKKHLHVV
jgi:hypothetical protein